MAKMLLSPELIEREAMNYMSKAEVAARLGMSLSSLERRFKDNPALEEAYWRGKANLKTWAVQTLKKTLMEKPKIEGLTWLIEKVGKQTNLVEQREARRKDKVELLGDVLAIATRELERLQMKAIDQGELDDKDSRALERYTQMLLSMDKHEREIDERTHEATDKKFLVLDVASMTEEQRKKRLAELEAKRAKQLGAAFDE